ncbi:MAG TPA: c-type cytochrome domain-containing protein [Polyangia bacterium]
MGGTSSSSSSSGSGGAGGATASSISFSGQILPLLKTNCVSCHGSSQQNGGVRLDTYAQVKTNLTRAASAISSGIMPPGGGLNATQKQLFAAWVNQGAPNN